MRYLFLLMFLTLIGCTGVAPEDMEPEERYQAWMVAREKCDWSDMDCHVEVAKKYHGPCYAPWKECFDALEDTADRSCDPWLREKTWAECKE